jgi:hypothetical protein
MVLDGRRRDPIYSRDRPIFPKDQRVTTNPHQHVALFICKMGFAFEGLSFLWKHSNNSVENFEKKI